MSEVKSIVEENEDLKNQVAEALSSLKGYEKDYDELCEENENLKAELELYKSQIADLSASEEEKEEAMEDEEEAMEDEEATEEEKEAVVTEDDAVDQQAQVLAKALRQLGVAQPVTTKPKAVELSREEVLAKFSAITDPKEKGQFFAQHRNQIFN